MGASSQPEVDCDEGSSSSSKPVIYLGKRIRDDNEFSKHFENCITTACFSQSGWFDRFQRIPFPNSQLKLVSSSTSSIERPPKV
jgi:hypothetical protein